MQKEEWRKIDGHDGYEVSNLGRVRSLPKKVLVIKKDGTEYYTTYPGCILRPRLDHGGYLRLKLGGVKDYRVHRLVAGAFNPNPDNLPVINHKDENKTNNTPENLEWCTIRYNTLYNNHQFRCAESRRKNDPEHLWTKKMNDTKRKNGVFDRIGQKTRERCSKRVIQLDMGGNHIKEWRSITDAANYYNTDTTKICAVCNGKRKSCRGYKWRYA